jgi:EAL domain-containing protein (putative c-di-GMP-specific phosphodiesterase class I)
LKSDPLSKVTVRALVEVAKVLGIPTLADCVERSEVLEELADLGVNFAQGFLIGIPRPIEAFFKAEL